MRLKYGKSPQPINVDNYRPNFTALNNVFTSTVTEMMNNKNSMQ